MNCPATLWNLPGLRCTRTDEHDTHVYIASALGDAHDEAEARAEEGR